MKRERWEVSNFRWWVSLPFWVTGYCLLWIFCLLVGAEFEP